MHVFIAMVDQSWLAYMYGPALRTLREGLDAAKRRFGSHALHYSFLLVPNLLHNLSVVGNGSSATMCGDGTRIHAGDVLIYVGVVQNWNPSRLPWQPLRALGVRTVHLNTEPYENDAVCGRRGLIVGTDELWEFSHRNVHVCEQYNTRHSRAQDVRYVPCGAQSLPRLAHQPTSKAASLVLWGAIFSYRRHCWEKLGKSKALRERMTHIYTVWNVSQLQQALERPDYGIFLDIYKECNLNGLLTSPGQVRAPPSTGLALRMSFLGSARGLLLSSRVFWKDEQAYAGMVDFVDLPNLEAKFWELVNMSAARREAMAEERFQRFARAFAPEIVFERAGIFEMLERRILDQRAMGTKHGNRPLLLQTSPSVTGGESNSPCACFLRGTHGVKIGSEHFSPTYVDLDTPISL